VEAPTEQRNARTVDIDTVSTLDMLRLINAEDALVPGAVSAVLPELARAVDLTVEALRSGGRLHYFGAGTSGRIGVMDAAELPPTYGTEPEQVVAHHAGGFAALVHAVEDVEDDEEGGAADAAQASRRAAGRRTSRARCVPPGPSARSPSWSAPTQTPRSRTRSTCTSASTRAPRPSPARPG
jgi:N-acetylmuramic acid 6-phosphate etherase